jgi:phage terminase large subunit-like protein
MQPEHARAEAERAYLEALEIVRARSRALEGPSLWMRWSRLPRAERQRIRDSFTDGELAALAYAWAAWARPKQRPPSELIDGFRIILWLMGRGGGKTRSAAERIRERVDAGARSIALIAPTLDDVEIYMLGRYEDDEGLLNVFPPNQRPHYNVDKGIVRFHKRATGYVYSAEKPELRGPNFDTVWWDEPAQCRFLDRLWANIDLATRKPGAVPIEILLTTTPRPLQFLKDRIADPDCMTIIGNTDENPHNDEKWLARMKRQFAGTRTGAQELEAEILGDDPNALFWPTVIEASRVEVTPDDLRIAIACDPAISTTRKSDDTGIVTVGIDDSTGHLYVLGDLTGRYPPDEWGDKIVATYEKAGAVAVVGETNRGGDLVEANVRAAMLRKRGNVAARALNFESVHAYRGKTIRAEPVSNLHRQGFIHFVGYAMKEMENEITTWNPKSGVDSPNRLDALVWAVYYLADLGGDDVRPDYRAGFEGVAQANAIIQRQHRASSVRTAPGPASFGAGTLPATSGSSRSRRL